MTEPVLVTIEERVLRIEMNRPEKKNALTVSMYADMAAALKQADADDAVRAILIHGQVDCFTAGNDLQDFLDVSSSLEDSSVDHFTTILPTVRKPLVAAVGGVAVGIGTTMLLHFDLVYAAENARFILPFINLALVPEAASSMLLPRLAGYQRAAELLMLGEPFDAEQAREIGFVNRVVPPDALMEQAFQSARSLAEKPPAAMLAAKELLKRGAESVEARMQAENAIFSECLVSPEAKEAMTAFVERRKPDFSNF
jgi:enoyl-CoA hydratase/carnithine racemase